jgi:hypothetical protein
MTLSPKASHQVVLLPQDREIMALTGLSESEYRQFVRDIQKYSRIAPGTIVNLSGFEIILINLVIGAALSYAATLLMPKPRQPQQPDITTSTVQGQDIVNGARYTPKSGFDSVQNVVELGSVIPLVYAKRQVIDGVSYGGCRVNTNLLWSQIYSVGGGQLLRAMFLVSEGAINSVDSQQFAIGNNLLTNYDLAGSNHGRITIYYRGDGGRIKSTDRIAGQLAANDVGNAENDGGGDVFQVRSTNNFFEPDFCFTSTPSNQNTFGVHGFIGNNFAFKLNPVFRPAVQLQPSSTNTVRCPNDWQAQAQRRKQGTVFSGRSGLVAASSQQRNVVAGDTFTYTLFTSTDQNRKFIEVNSQGADGEETCGDIAQAVAGRQRGYDEGLTIGQIYKVGTCVAICTSRTDATFISESDNSGVGTPQSVSADFQVIRPGVIFEYSQADIEADGGYNASQRGHILKFAEAVFATDREAKIVEVGFRSSVQLQINGMTNMRDAHSYQRCDNEACFNYNNQNADGIQAIVYQSGTYSSPDTRFSFFRIGYRPAGSDSPYTELDELFAIRSATGAAVYNYLRFEYTESNRWDIRFSPISAYEVRHGFTQNTHVNVLDYKGAARSVVAGDLTLRFTGAQVARSTTSFNVAALTTPDYADLGIGFDDEYFYADAWARCSEAFIYNEITTSANSPEHSIVYVNTIAENPVTPQYDNMAIVGVNIRSSTEISKLSQFSVYVNEGLGGTSDFPDVLYDLMTNKRYGVGSILSPEQVDKQSFDDAAAFTYDRRYFFDGAVSERSNIRSWGAKVANDYLLDLVVRNGKFALQPVATFGGPETITGLYTAGNIIDNSFEISFADLQDRVPVRVSVKWRQEKESSNIEARGLFPVLRQVTVREPDVDASAPIEAIDVSDYVTSQEQAIDRAKWEIRQRRYVTHSIKFKTTPSEASVDIGSVFKLGLETVSYNQPANGAIADDGTVTSWPELADGTYTCLFWDGTSKDIEEKEIKILKGKTNHKNAVFCIKNSVVEAQTYKTQSVSFDQDGNIEVEATYFPTDSNGYSLLTKDWYKSNNWIIEGTV